MDMASEIQHGEPRGQWPTRDARPALKVIGLSGKMGSGKSTVASQLMGLIPGSVVLSFAGPLKREAASVYGFPEALAYSESGKKSLVALSPEGEKIMGRGMATVREILQAHGTMRRAEDPEYWDKQMTRALDILEGNGVPLVVVDDVRFPSEVATLAHRGARLYRIEPYPGWIPSETAQHASETALDDFPFWDSEFCPEHGIGHLEAISAIIAGYART
jgi:hypothetical protein